MSVVCVNDTYFEESVVDIDIVDKLIAAGIDLRYQNPDENNETALMSAASQGYVEAVKVLVAAGPEPAHLNMKVSIA